jgi:hypothetical protein
MANEEIVIEIDRDGGVIIEGKYFEDAECKALTRELEADLGVVTNVVEKPEMTRGRSRTRTNAR